MSRGKEIVTDAKQYGLQNFQDAANYYAASNKTRFVYMNNVNVNGRWSIKTYYHDTDTWSTSVEFDTTNHAGGDGHRYPIVYHDNLGHVHVFYGAHQQPLRHARSDSPDATTSWTLATPIATFVTYPQIVSTTEGTFYLIHRNASTDSWMRKSTNNMNTWTDGTVVTRSDSGNLLYDLSYPFGVTLGTNSGTQAIHIFGSFRMFSDANTKGRDPWYLKSLDGGTTWKTANGTTLSVPIGPSEIGSPYRGKAYEFSGCIDSRGNPHLFFNIERPGTTSSHGDPYVLMHAYHNGTTWSTFRVSDSSQNTNWGYRCAYDGARIWLGWDATTSTYNITTGSTIGDLKQYLSSSANNGSTFTTETLRSVSGPVYVPGYVYLKWIPEIRKLHIYWAGPPDDATSPRSIFWEAYDVDRPSASKYESKALLKAFYRRGRRPYRGQYPW